MSLGNRRHFYVAPMSLLLTPTCSETPRPVHSANALRAPARSWAVLSAADAGINSTQSLLLTHNLVGEMDAWS